MHIKEQETQHQRQSETSVYRTDMEREARKQRQQQQQMPREYEGSKVKPLEAWEQLEHDKEHCEGNVDRNMEYACDMW